MGPGCAASNTAAHGVQHCWTTVAWIGQQRWIGGVSVGCREAASHFGDSWWVAGGYVLCVSCCMGFQLLEELPMQPGWFWVLPGRLYSTVLKKQRLKKIELRLVAS